MPEGEFGIIVGKHSMDETLTATHVFADEPSAASLTAATTSTSASASFSVLSSADVDENEGEDPEDDESA